MIKLAIVHFQPLEKYPPVINMLRYIAGLQIDGLQLQVISTEADNGKKLLEVEGVTIHRVGKMKEGLNRIDRLFFIPDFRQKLSHYCVLINLKKYCIMSHCLLARHVSIRTGMIKNVSYLSIIMNIPPQLSISKV
ncbi:hypothetical protein [Paraflavitalea speifideaquila]|uniref:hypothetical protein n=1 Tax=Paraflavitalea speifideaquila TaxID=3076558 RepID=UPI0028F01790|nr:hypothetical protein [Paraflavitalea speifideiaquila]